MTRTWLSAAFVAAASAAPDFGVAAQPARPFTCPERTAQLESRRLSAADLAKATLVCANLRNAVLDGLDLGQVDLTGADARGASFADAKLGQASLVRADLRGASFRRARLGQAHLDGARLEKADLAGAVLTQAELTGADASGASFADARLGQANLAGTRLERADLTRADLTQADLRGCDLRGAILWRTHAIQAETKGARIRVFERGAVQLAYVLMVAAVLFLVASLRALFRSPGPGMARRLAGVLVSLLGFHLFVGGLLGAFAGMLVPLWTVDAGPLGRIGIAAEHWGLLAGLAVLAAGRWLAAPGARSAR